MSSKGCHNAQVYDAQGFNLPRSLDATLALFPPHLAHFDGRIIARLAFHATREVAASQDARAYGCRSFAEWFNTRSRRRSAARESSRPRAIISSRASLYTETKVRSNLSPFTPRTSALTSCIVASLSLAPPSFSYEASTSSPASRSRPLSENNSPSSFRSPPLVESPASQLARSLATMSLRDQGDDGENSSKMRRLVGTFYTPSKRDSPSSRSATLVLDDEVERMEASEASGLRLGLKGVEGAQEQSGGGDMTATPTLRHSASKECVVSSSGEVL